MSNTHTHTHTHATGMGALLGWVDGNYARRQTDRQTQIDTHWSYPCISKFKWGQARVAGGGREGGSRKESRDREGQRGGG